MAQSPDDSPLVEGLIQDSPPPASPKTQPFWKNPLTLSMMAADAADSFSTNLGHGVEQNPLLPRDHAANAVAQGLSSVAKAYLVNKLSKSHPTLAKILGMADIGIGAYDTTSNLHFNATGRPLPNPWTKTK